MEDNILTVKNLKVSFWTNNGTVKAVRDISFDLKRGETLAIVGESGSGKSVTSKAVLGILAGNAIVEGGEILYDGKDLLRISEDDMYKIRGDKISMIFQDPLSSLDPIVKIGKQITEAMILKNKDSRKNARKEFNNKLLVLENKIIEAIGDEHKEEVAKLCKDFDDFNIKAIELSNSYHDSLTETEESIAFIEDFIFLVEHKQKVSVTQRVNEIIAKLNRVTDQFLTYHYANELETNIKELENLVENYKKLPVLDESAEAVELKKVCEKLNAAKEFLAKLVNQEKPNFFRIGFYALKNPVEDLYKMDITEANEMTLKYLDDNFMLKFREFEKQGVEKAYHDSYEGKQDVLKYLETLKSYFNKDVYDKKDTLAQIATVNELIELSLNHLEINKDSVAYTFPIAIKKTIKQLFKNLKNNEKEEKRFARQTAKRDAKIAKGKKIDWKVVPKNIVTQEESVENIIKLIDRLYEKYSNDVENFNSIDFEKTSVDLIDHFKELASIVVYKVTETIAKERAIKLMEEVGIPEPRIRYNQYPFEFSGGMRQRIVIAIALSANPDILICDEPTTALDVTIQSQILELINKIKKERNLSIIFITHDLGVVANMADRIAVMYAGKIVEYGTSNEVFYDPRHPYTWALLSSMPDLDTKEKLEAIPGTPPNMIYPPVGDAFAARNKYALKIDYEMQPPLFKVTDTHYAATWLLHEKAPKVEIPKVITNRIERMKKRDEELNKNKETKVEAKAEVENKAPKKPNSTAKAEAKAETPKKASVKKAVTKTKKDGEKDGKQ